MKQTFKTGDRVVKIAGSRLEGKIIPDFSLRLADGISYRPPVVSGVVWVEWQDGTSGWVSEVAIRMRWTLTSALWTTTSAAIHPTR